MGATLTRFNTHTHTLPPEFYLWGYLKDQVYENNSQTIGDLRQQLRPGSDVFVSLTISRTACKCACDAKGVI